ncbi:hypothetical protein ZIOFF_013676 [Zingiber officinale]|uniref:Uncharacterized protein n=1 Tax=Zingiber officinale TaxID=94328 RepID=A0A8J5HS72_ZINOF|nr:hypothetical protein ZIOFF_013676 [Zingiber officinale]
MRTKEKDLVVVKTEGVQETCTFKEVGHKIFVCNFTNVEGSQWVLDNSLAKWAKAAVGKVNQQESNRKQQLLRDP